MKYIVLIKANEKTEAGVLPSEQLLTEMTAFNEELVKAGVMLAGEGLHPSAKGARVTCTKGQYVVTDGPFIETRELICGFWIWQANSLEEAIAWAKRIPNPDNEDGEVEIRQVFDVADFGAEFTPESRAKDAELRAQLEAKP
jgi:hypothetical protein